MAFDSTLPRSGGILPGQRYSCDVALRWGDMDAFNHLNNVVYFRLMEEARVQLFSGSGLQRPNGKVTVLAHVSCDFVKPLHYPGTVRVTLTLVRVGRSSMEVDVTLVRTDEPDTVCAKGRNVLVWMDAPSGKSEPWPAEVLSGLVTQFA